MRRVLLFFIFMLSLLSLQAQGQRFLLDHQAVARDALGRVLTNEVIVIQAKFTSNATGEAIYYSEKHELKTDQNGYFNLVLGKGQEQQGNFELIPWSNQLVWLETAISLGKQPNTILQNSQSLLSVPYAQYAKTAQELVVNKEIEARNQSIYWLSGGNRDTRPPIHFIGTRDAQDFVIKTQDKELIKIKENGQFQVLGRVSGKDSEKKNYPLTIKAKKQGIWIVINENRSSSNNFVTFEDTEGIQGRIEGQTVGEFFLDPFFLIQQAANIAEGVKLGTTIAANAGKGASDVAAAIIAAATLFFIWQSPGWTAAGVGEFAGMAAAIVESIALATNVIGTTAIKVRDIGVQYSTGSEDYAEYLERFAVEKDMLPGEIVAIKGGKITRNTEGAQMIKVISYSPAVSGNMPQPHVAGFYEQVAFLGQVYVKINGGANAGDYILPSGNNDGLGIAVAPENMLTRQYGQIVGVAWESVPVRPLQKVKIGIGMNRNELAPKVAELSQRVDHIVNYLEGKGPLHPEKEFSDYLADHQPANGLDKLWSDEEFDQIIDQQADELKAVYQAMGEKMNGKSASLTQIPGFKSFLDDPINNLKTLRRDPRLESYWAQFDRMVQEKMKQQDN